MPYIKRFDSSKKIVDIYVLSDNDCFPEWRRNTTAGRSVSVYEKSR